MVFQLPLFLIALGVNPSALQVQQLPSRLTRRSDAIYGIDGLNQPSCQPGNHALGRY